MDRFDEMRTKGINTNDATATASDILSGKTAYVAGSKITGELMPTQGGEGGDLANIGFSIDIEAQTAIAVGDSIVCVKNDETATPRIVTNANGVTFSAVNEDLTIAIVNPTFNSATNSITIYFMNDGGSYDGEIFEISNSQVQAMLTELGLTSVTGTAKMNEDGGTCIISFGENCVYFLVLSINISTKQLDNYSFQKRDDLPLNYSEENTSGWYVSSVSDFIVTHNYLILTHSTIKGTYTNPETSEEKTRTYNRMLFYVVNGTSISFNDLLSETAYVSGFGWYNDYLILATRSANHSSYSYSTYLKKIKVTNSLVSKTGEVMLGGVTSPDDYSSKVVGNISKNCKYVSYIAYSYLTSGSGSSRAKYYFYILDPATLTFTSVWTLPYVTDNYNKNAPPYMTNDGTYFASTNGIYNYEGTKIYNAYYPLTYFDVKRWISGANTCSISPTTIAEYLASKITTFKMESNKLYGVASEDLTVGMRGTARGLFDSSNWLPNLQEKTITPSAETQIVEADVGYDALTSVTVTGDENLIAENIKKDVEIFGVIGTLDESEPTEPTLPSEYKEVEYLESTGTQYIDTGVSGGSDAGYEIKLNTLGSVATNYEQYFAGDSDTSIYKIYAMTDSPQNIVLQSTTTNNYAKRITLYSLTNSADHVIKVKAGDVYLDNSLIESNSYVASSGWGDLTFFIFNAHEESTLMSSMRLYYLKMWNGNTLVRDFIPCYRKSDSVAGLYDLVNNVFYTNAGTGVFSVGADVTA